MKTPQNIWKNSEALEILQKQKKKKKLRIAFLDIDFTMSGNPSVALEIRGKLTQMGFITIFVSSRTEEMIMSKKEYEISKRFGFSRAKPKLKTDANGKTVYAFIDEIASQRGLYNPEIIVGSTGSTILVKQIGGGYVEDRDFKNQIGESPKKWKENTLKVIKMLDPKNALVAFAAIDTPGSYERGEIDVEGSDYRIQLEVKGEDSKKALANKLDIYERFKKVRDREKLNIYFVDDSDSSEGRYTFYLTPLKAWKPTAVQHIIEKVIDELGVEPKDIETFFAGDGYPDLTMGIEAGKGTKGTFLVVGGSRISAALLGETKDFAGIPLEEIRGKTTKIGEGRYLYGVDGEGAGEGVIKREIIIGDIAYKGTKGPESILKFLQEME